MQGDASYRGKFNYFLINFKYSRKNRIARKAYKKHEEYSPNIEYIKLLNQKRCEFGSGGPGGPIKDVIEAKKKNKIKHINPSFFFSNSSLSISTPKISLFSKESTPLTTC